MARPKQNARPPGSFNETLGLAEQLQAQFARCPGPVPLIDGFVDSSWTVAATAGLLYQASTPAALPLTLALALAE